MANSGRVEVLKGMVEDFKTFVAKNNVDDPDAYTLVTFLKAKGFNDNEIENVFQDLGYPIDMNNVHKMKDDDPEYQKEKEESINEVFKYVKKMKKPEIRLLADLLATYVAKHGRKPQMPSNIKKAKPHYRRHAVTSPLEESYQAYLFEDSSTMRQKALVRDDAEKLLVRISDDYNLRVSKGKVFDLWARKFSNSTTIEDLNELLKLVGFNKLGNPIQRMAKKYGYPIVKAHQISYVQKIADIIIDYDLAEDVLKILQERYKVKVDESKQISEGVTLGDVLKGAATKVAQKMTQQDNTENADVVERAREWFNVLKTASTEQQQETLLLESVNLLAEIYGTNGWKILREKMLAGINTMNQLDRNTIQDAIKKINAGQKSKSMTESMVKKVLATMLVNEYNTYMRD